MVCRVTRRPVERFCALNAQRKTARHGVSRPLNKGCRGAPRQAANRAHEGASLACLTPQRVAAAGAALLAAAAAAAAVAAAAAAAAAAAEAAAAAATAAAAAAPSAALAARAILRSPFGAALAVHPGAPLLLCRPDRQGR